MLLAITFRNVELSPIKYNSVIIAVHWLRRYNAAKVRVKIGFNNKSISNTMPQFIETWIKTVILLQLLPWPK